MKKNKKALKGFTLIELIIVLALFSVIMTLVMSFIDPLSRLMTKTSTKERTASYADNISTYIDKSIRYSQFARVFENEYCMTGPGGAATPVTEEDAVMQFAEDFFDGVVNSDGEALEGKIHVLKLLNNPYELDSGDEVEEGSVVEKIYEFKASYYHDGEDSEVARDDTVVNVLKSDEMVLNEENFLEYSYFYNVGLYNLEPITELGDEDGWYYNSPSGAITPDVNAKEYFSRLVPRNMTGGYLEENTAINNMSANNLVINIVSYKKGNKTNTVYNTGAVGEADKEVSVFKSPANMHSIGMSLRNILNSEGAVLYYQKSIKTEDGHSSIEYIENEDPSAVKVPKLSPVTSFVSKPFTYYRCEDPASQTQNVYIIYSVPSEVSSAAITNSFTGGGGGGEGGELPPPL